jgi:hypothetical protein
MGKFINIGYVAESKKSKNGESDQTFVLTIKPQDKTLSSIQLPAGAKILLKAPKQNKMSDEDFAKLSEWKLFEAVLIVDEDGDSNGL